MRYFLSLLSLGKYVLETKSAAIYNFCRSNNVDCGTVLRESTVLREKMDAIIEAQEIH